MTNLYVHFPFCRAKCAYCALLSRAGASEDVRAAYVRRLVDELRRLAPPGVSFDTVYFGGGTPALCDLRPLLEEIAPRLAPGAEFTVELHPRDADASRLRLWRSLGVNRVSLGVQSLDDDALSAMGRLHTADEAEAAFRAVRDAGFANAGVDLIAGWPGTSDSSWRRTVERAVALGLDHCSVYTLIREPKTRLDLALSRGAAAMPSADAAFAQLSAARDALASAGLPRYEVSNYARPGLVCRHNLAVWRGEDYFGLGEGAHGRIGLRRTLGRRDGGCDVEALDEEADALERALFALRLAEGFDPAAAARRWPVLVPRLPQWRRALSALASEGILHEVGPGRFAPTGRGFEVCDAIVAELL